jgi:Fur family zinc uptake transcriptional regulator
VKVYEMVGIFSPGRATAPPTIYRAFNALVELGLAYRIESLNAYLACRTLPAGPAAFLLICDGCGLVEEIVPPIEAVNGAMNAQSTFLVTRVGIEARGRCAACQAHAARSASLRGPINRSSG